VLAGVGVRRGGGDNRVPLSAHRWVIESADDSTESAGAAAVRGVARAALPSRRRQRKQTFFSTHWEIGTTLPAGPIESRYESQYLDLGAFWSTRRQLFFFFGVLLFYHMSTASRNPDPVPAFGPRMVCVGCDMIGADARLNWRERYDPRSLSAAHAGDRISLGRPSCIMSIWW